MNKTLIALVAAASLAACKNLAVQDQSAGSLVDLQTNPNPTSLATAAQGLMVGSRFNMPFQVILVGSQGREGFSLDPSDAGWRNVMVTFDNTTFYAGSYFNWRDIYRNIRQEQVVLAATDVTPNLTDAQKAGIKGFTHTFEALDLMNIIALRDTNGAVIDPNPDVGGAPGPVVGSDAVYNRINSLLDQGFTELTSAGNTPFAIKLSPGFTGFDTPNTFIKFNRALRARSAVYRKDYTTALTALAASFLNTASPMSLGAYHWYTTNSGDALPNPLLYDPTGRILVADTMLRVDVQKQADGVTPDKRYTQKIIQLGAPKTFNGIKSDLAFNVYPTNVSPIPIIRNEDLILLRAEARWFNTGAPDKAGAIADINVVRQISGGLEACGVGPACTLTIASTDSEFIDALLYERRYSLLWEGGHRWLDMRRFGRLGSLPLMRAGDHVFSAWPIPSDECQNRSPQPSGCVQPLAASQTIK